MNKIMGTVGQDIDAINKDELKKLKARKRNEVKKQRAAS